MLANVYRRLSVAARAFGDHRAFNSSINIYSIYFLYGLASLGKSIFFSRYTIYPGCHELVTLLMLHAVSLDQLHQYENGSKGVPGEEITIK